MTIEELILKALDKCLETAEGEQRWLFLWMKAALQYPGLEEFIREAMLAENCRGNVSLESLHKAIEFAGSFNELQIRSLSTSDKEKNEMACLEKIRLKEVGVRIAEALRYLGWLN